MSQVVAAADARTRGSAIDAAAKTVGARTPEGIRLVVQDATGTAGSRQGRRTIDVGSLRRTPSPNAVTSFSEIERIFGDYLAHAERFAGSAPRDDGGDDDTLEATAA